MKAKFITYSLGIATSMLLSRAFKQSGKIRQTSIISCVHTKRRAHDRTGLRLIEALAFRSRCQHHGKHETKTARSGQNQRHTQSYHCVIRE